MQLNPILVILAELFRIYSLANRIIKSNCKIDRNCYIEEALKRNYEQIPEILLRL